MTLLDVEGIDKSFAGIHALSNVSLAVEANERVGLIGPNGAGKTTLFNCILGVLSTDSGTMVFNGRNLQGLAVHHRARAGIGRTFQRIELFADATVREHLLIADRVRRGRGGVVRDILGMGRTTAEETDRADELLELLGLEDVADEPIEALSLGKGRLVEVGRALMTEPKLLLLDEPSSGLDRDETAALAMTLRSVQHERRFAILLVEHDVELVSNFTERTYVLDFGSLIASGSTPDVMKDPVVRKAYLGEVAQVDS